MTMPPTIRSKRTFQECLERGHDDPVAFAEDFLDVKVHNGQANWLRTRNDAKERMLHCSNRWGKAVHVDTAIPTPEGWTTMGALQVGDEVLDEQGNPCRVTHATEVQYNRPCYEVVFSDGSTIIADADHQWLTWTYEARRGEENRRRRGWNPKHPPSVVTTEQIRATLKKYGRLANHSVKTTETLQLPERLLPIGPYTLGAFLGDVCKSTGHICGADAEIFEEIRNEGYGTRHYRKACACQNYQVRTWDQEFGAPSKSFLSLLKRLNIWKNKHIPATYLRASEAQRLALLQGLMDTDGSVQEGGHCEIILTLKPLALDVFELICTLGLKPTWKEERARIGPQDCGPRYRISFTTNKPVFRLPRKLQVIQKTAKPGPTLNHRYIVGVRPSESVPVRCIMVDSPNHLYLCGKTFIPTHNSFIAGVKLLHRAFYQIRNERYARDANGRLKPYTAISIAMSLDQARLAWDYALILASNSSRFSKFVVNTDHSPFPCLYISNAGTGKDKIVSEVWARSTAKRAKYLLGKHFAFISYDEAAFDMDGETVWNNVLRMRLADEDGDIDFTSTPNLKNWFFAQCEKGRLKEDGLPSFLPSSYIDPRCYTQTGVIFDNPHIAQDAVRKQMEYMTEVQRAQNVYGQFADAASVFSVAHVEACYRDQDYRDLMGNEGLPADYEVDYLDKEEQCGRLARLRKSDDIGTYVVGADLARKRDKTVIIVLRVDKQPAQMVMYKAFSRTSWKTVYEEIQRASLKYHNAQIMIDSTGVGDGVLDALQNEPYSLTVQGYNFAGSGKEKQNLVIHLQEAIQNRRLSFPFIRELYDELVYYEWEDKKLRTDSLFALALAWECNLRRLGAGAFDPGPLDTLVAVAGFDPVRGRVVTTFDLEPRLIIPEEELERLRRLAEEERLRRYAEGEDLSPEEYGVHLAGMW